jgi:toxin secretion/phage lysis holin
MADSSSAWQWILWKVVMPIAVAVSAAFGGWTPAMTTLLIFMALDILTGLMRAYLQKVLSSSVSFKGMCKKVFILVIVMVAWRLDIVIGAGSIMRDATVIFFIVSEGLSILENAAAADLPIPEFLKKALIQLNEKKAAPLDR